MAGAIEWDDAQFQALVRRGVEAGLHPKALMAEISFDLVESTGERFDKGVDPDGVAWEALKPATIARKTKPGFPRPTSPLIGRGDLSRRPQPDFDDDHAGVSVAAPQARLHQFGGTADMPPGPAAVPARPYLGVSADDEVGILEAASAWLGKVARG